MRFFCTALLFLGVALWLFSVQPANRYLLGLPTIPPVCLLLGGLGAILLLSKKHGSR